MLDDTSKPDLAFAGVRQLAEAFRDGSATPADAAEAAFAQIDSRNGEINAFAFVDRDRAFEAAARSAERWKAGRPLSAVDGVPATVKDVMMVDGWETTFGSRVLGSGRPSDWSSPAVDRLLEAGAVLIGQTTTPEIGWKGVTDNTRHGVTRNPWNDEKTPGGSSGGAGAAAAMGAGVLHVGTDGGGSIRIPAAFSGIVGHKPSYGRVPAYPASPYSTLAHVGPMTRSVEDAAIMLSILARPDLRDWHAGPYPVTKFEDALGRSIAGRRIAYSPDLGYADVQPETAKMVHDALQTFRDLGALVQEVAPPFEPPRKALEVLWFAGMAARIRPLDAARRELLDPGLLALAQRGEKIDLADYMAATAARAEFGSRLKRYFADWDFLVTPTVPRPAFDVDAPSPDRTRGGWSDDWIPFTYPFNLSQQPACSVPCGLTGDGLPVGLQIVGAMHDDEGVLQAAHAFEQARPRLRYPDEAVD
ncbi:MAG: amidase [Pseudomonadota bacterium]